MAGVAAAAQVALAAWRATAEERCVAARKALMLLECLLEHASIVGAVMRAFPGRVMPRWEEEAEEEKEEEAEAEEAVARAERTVEQDPGRDKASDRQEFVSWDVEATAELEGVDTYEPAGGFDECDKPNGVHCTVPIDAACVPNSVLAALGQSKDSGVFKMSAISISGLVARRFSRVEAPHSVLKTSEVHTKALARKRRGIWLAVRRGGRKFRSDVVGFLKLANGVTLPATNLFELARVPSVCASLGELRIICKAPEPKIC